MAQAGTPTVSKNLLHTGQKRPILLDSPAWFNWLETATRFSYSTRWPGYRLTVRKEKRGNGHYWFAYLKNNRKLHNCYVGKSAALTAARLESVAAYLLHQSRLPYAQKEDTHPQTDSSNTTSISQ